MEIGDGGEEEGEGDGAGERVESKIMLAYLKMSTQSVLERTVVDSNLIDYCLILATTCSIEPPLQPLKCTLKELYTPFVLICAEYLRIPSPY